MLLCFLWFLGVTSSLMLTRKDVGTKINLGGRWALWGVDREVDE
jgi:hypothetical protein